MAACLPSGDEVKNAVTLTCCAIDSNYSVIRFVYETIFKPKTMGKVCTIKFYTL